MKRKLLALVFLFAAAAIAQASEKEYKKVLDKIEEWKSAYPDLITVRSIGTSEEGRDLTVLRISASKKDKPGIYFGGSIHGNEYSHQELIHAMDGVLEQSETSGVRKLLKKRVIWVQLMVNPDGVFHRTRKNANDVDLNRNFGFKWGSNWGRRPPTNKRHMYYIGEKAFSEKESRAVRDFLRKETSIVTYFDYHRAAHVILAPYGAVDEELNETFTDFWDGLNEAMGDYNRGRDPRIKEMFKNGSGYAIDWVYGELGIYAFTIEFPGLRRARSSDKQALIDGALYLIKAGGKLKREKRRQRKWY